MCESKDGNADLKASRVNPLVSIILPTYNRAARLPSAIASCSAQTYANIEIVVVDDGSPDNTGEIVERIAASDPRVRYVRQDNAKLPAALNTGHREALGDYLTWTSDDNQYDEDAIELMSAFLDENPDIGLVYCNVRVVDGAGNELEVRHYPDPDKIWNGSCVGACFLYRREVYEAIGDYDTNLFLAEDYDFWLRVSKQFKMHHIQGDPHYTATFHGDSLSERFRPEVDLQCARARAKNAPTLLRRCRYMGVGSYDAAFRYRERGDFSASFKHLLRSLRYWPFSFYTYRAVFGVAFDALKTTLRAGTIPSARRSL